MLTDLDLPPLYHAADASSGNAQRRFLLATRLRLISLLAAAFFGLFTPEWAGVLVASWFGVALVVEVYSERTRPEQTWYEARAVAESVKTLSWRYSVGGEPFRLQATSEPVAANQFLDQLRDLFDVIKGLDLILPSSSDQQISESMRKVRASSLAERKRAYELGRVAQQQLWYQTKAGWNRARAARWTGVMLTIEIVGLVCGILKAAGAPVGDLLGFAGAIVTAVAAWLQARQHRTLATAYAVTALELASVRSKIGAQDTEADWAAFVADAEEAFSREHTLWKASRGTRSL